MYQDRENNFSQDQVLLVAGTPVTSTDVYDAGAATNLGGGERRLKPFVHISAKGGTTPTLRCRLRAADNAALTSNPIDIYDSAVLADPVAVPQLLKGAIPSHAPKQFFGFIYDLVGTGATFTVTAGLTLDTPTIPAG